jgi:uncharacterized Zn finger protein
MSTSEPTKDPDGRPRPLPQPALKDMQDIACENCGCKYFRQVNSFKKVSALLSPTGREQIIPVPTFRCDECGFINEEFRIKESE